MAGTLTTRRPRSLFSSRREPLLSLRGEMEDLLSRFWDGESEWFGGNIMPSVDFSETDKSVEVTMDLPGMKPNEIDIELNNNVLTVKGERKEEKEEKGKTYHRVERHSGTYSRSFTLPCAVAEDEVAAEYKDGILTITLPKTEEAKARKVKVNG